MYADYFVGYYDRLMTITTDNDRWVEAFLRWIYTQQSARQHAGEQ